MKKLLDRLDIKLVTQSVNQSELDKITLFVDRIPGWQLDIADKCINGEKESERFDYVSFNEYSYSFSTLVFNLSSIACISALMLLFTVSMSRSLPRREYGNS